MKARPFRPLLLLLLLCLLLASVSAQQACRRYKFRNGVVFASCADLPALYSYLHYTYDDVTRHVSIAYRQPGVSPSQWIAWAINPSGSGMAGSQALVAHLNFTPFSGSGSVRVYTAPVAGYMTKLGEGELSFDVSELRACYYENEMIVFATIDLSWGGSKVNHLWQVGPMNGGVPGIHQASGDHLKSMSTIDFQSGKASGEFGVRSNIMMRNIHGVLNAVSWGVMMPMGAIFARYLKVWKAVNPAWFCLHIACQTSAYAIGVAGWGIGLKLGSESGIKYSVHWCLGIAVFCFGTLQVCELILRPKKDPKIRMYWNIYHHTTGYAVIALSIFNIYKGFEILGQDGWKRVYTCFIIALGAIVVIIELFRWIVVLIRKKGNNAGQ